MTIQVIKENLKMVEALMLTKVRIRNLFAVVGYFTGLIEKWNYFKNKEPTPLCTLCARRHGIDTMLGRGDCKCQIYPRGKVP